MAVKRQLVKEPPRKLFEISKFYGADFTTPEPFVEPFRSPDNRNMISQSDGIVRKRTGHYIYKKYPAKINGWYQLVLEQTYSLIHAGEVIYLDNGTGDYTDDTVLYSSANNSFSVAQQLNKKLWISDGKAMLVYDGTEIKLLTEVAFVPTILINRAPTGGGELLMPINLMQPKKTEKFIGTSAATAYQLSATTLDATTVTAEKVTSGGGTTALIEGTDFAVNRTTGVVTFTVAPGVPPVAGESNVFITYAKTVAGEADKINKTRITTTYGVGGGRDRIFATGNPDHPNYDWYCQFNDPTFWGDTWYSIMGQDISPVQNYRMVNNLLATVKRGDGEETCIYLRNGRLNEEGEAEFISAGNYPGIGAVSPYAFADLEIEATYLSGLGIIAVTPSDVLGERYGQNRSYWLDEKLKASTGLSSAYAVAHGRYYYLTDGKDIYILDGSQASRERDDPYSNRQYEGYYWNDINARLLWIDHEALCFGQEDGTIRKFHTDYENINSFVDESEIGVFSAIPAQWRTIQWFSQLPANKKKFRELKLQLGAAPYTGCQVWGEYEGAENNNERLMDYSNEANFMQFSQLVFSKLTFRTMRMPAIIEEGINTGKIHGITFVIKNDRMYEPLTLYYFAAEYEEEA